MLTWSRLGWWAFSQVEQSVPPSWGGNWCIQEAINETLLTSGVTNGSGSEDDNDAQTGGAAVLSGLSCDPMWQQGPTSLHSTLRSVPCHLEPSQLLVWSFPSPGVSEAEVLQLEEMSRKCQATYFCCGVPKMNMWFATSLLWLPASELGSLPSAWVCEVDALWPWGAGKTGTGEAWGLRTLKPGQGHLRLVGLNSLINTVSKPHTWQTGCPGNTAREQTRQAWVFSFYSWFSLF